MTQQRAGFGLDEDQIDIEELTGSANNAAGLDKEELKKNLDKVGAMTGFVSRQPTIKKTRKRSPYIVQKNIKMRVGMPELLEQITSKLKAKSDQETIEIALGALLEREGIEGLASKYNKLLEK